MMKAMQEMKKLAPEAVLKSFLKPDTYHPRQTTKKLLEVAHQRRTADNAIPISYLCPQENNALPNDQQLFDRVVSLQAANKALETENQRLRDEVAGSKNMENEIVNTLADDAMKTNEELKQLKAQHIKTLLSARDYAAGYFMRVLEELQANRTLLTNSEAANNALQSLLEKYRIPLPINPKVIDGEWCEIR